MFFFQASENAWFFKDRAEPLFAAFASDVSQVRYGREMGNK
jgi:hypothetical protein